MTHIRLHYIVFHHTYHTIPVVNFEIESLFEFLVTKMRLSFLRSQEQREHGLILIHVRSKPCIVPKGVSQSMSSQRCSKQELWENEELPTPTSFHSTQLDLNQIIYQRDGGRDRVRHIKKVGNETWGRQYQ